MANELITQVTSEIMMRLKYLILALSGVYVVAMPVALLIITNTTASTRHVLVTVMVVSLAISLSGGLVESDVLPYLLFGTAVVGVVILVAGFPVDGLVFASSIFLAECGVIAGGCVALFVRIVIWVLQSGKRLRERHRAQNEAD